MQPPNQPEILSSPGTDTPSHIAWFSPRRKRFWAAIFVLLYTVTGFFVVPAVLQNQLVHQIDKHLHRDAVVEKIAFNPFALSLRMQGFEIRDRDQASLAKFDDFYINFQVSSLFRWAWTFAEIRLTSPQISWERFDDGTSRLDRLLEEINPADKAPQTTADEPVRLAPDQLPRLLISSIVLENGHALIRDHLPASPVEMMIGPVNIQVEQLNTLPDQSGRQQVAIQLPGGGTLGWQGSIAMTPLASQGTLVLKNLQLAEITPYLASQLAVTRFSAAVSSNLSYQVDLGDDGGLRVQVDPFTVEVDQLSVSGLTPDTEFLTIPRIAIEAGALRYPQRHVEIKHLLIDQPNLALWRDKTGDLSLSSLMTSANQAQPGGAAFASASSGQPDPLATAAPTWHFDLDKFTLHAGEVDFTDFSTTPVADVGIDSLNIELSSLSNRDNGSFPLDLTLTLRSGDQPAGNINLNGTFGLFPRLALKLNATTQKLALSSAQPWVNQFAAVTLTDGALDSSLNAEMTAGESMAITGSIDLSGLDIKESNSGEPLARWTQLSLDEIAAKLSVDGHPETLHIGRVTLHQPFVRLAIDKQGSNNLTGLTIPAASTAGQPPAPGPAEPPSPGAAPPGPFAYEIGSLALTDGELDFSDFSLPSPFTAQIRNLNGSVSAFGADIHEPATIALEGQVNQYGTARITGAINLADPINSATLSILLNNIDMVGVSPYSGRFAGTKINQGHLDVDLKYVIKQGKLQATNDLLLKDLTLGDRVDHPDAPDLPLGLALALLKDSKGVIDIKLPLTGDLNNPQFRVAPLIWKAFTGVIIKAATSPFRLLASLAGVDSDQLGQFQFRPGQATLTPAGLEKTAHLKAALQQRPELTLIISGATDPVHDRDALKLASLQNALAEQSGRPDNAVAAPLDRDRKALEKLFKKTLPDLKLKTVRQASANPAPEDPEAHADLDEAAYIDALRNQLLAAITITEDSLATLAQARAQAIETALITTQGLHRSRLKIGEPARTRITSDGWVLVKLTLSSK